MLRLICIALLCIALLVCLSQGLAAQQHRAPTVLFPSGNYAPTPAAPVPFAEKKATHAKRTVDTIQRARSVGPLHCAV
ncbi:hypothetical protein [Xanthomonas populi]|uniref:hypothetical protein n=1 Tax=Xanthomonas populi TaxID=53414 RepID=UPI001FC9A290|nr:hypothetical protein [Xanthomonas populi]